MLLTSEPLTEILQSWTQRDRLREGQDRRFGLISSRKVMRPYRIAGGQDRCELVICDSLSEHVVEGGR